MKTELLSKRIELASKYSGRTTPGDYDLGNGKTEHVASDSEMSVEISARLNKSVDKMHNDTIALADRAKEAREFLDWHTNSVRASWLDWNDESSKVMESIRQTRVAIGLESKKLLDECSDVRKFFLSSDHEKETTRLREFIELCERLRALKNDGTLDKISDTILKLA